MAYTQQTYQAQEVRPTVLTAPTKLPVSLDEARIQLRLTAPTDATQLSNENDELTRFIRAARFYYENRTGRTIHETQYEWNLNYWPQKSASIVLPRATPLILGSASVTYKDSTGLVTTWDAGHVHDGTDGNAEWYEEVKTTPGQVVLMWSRTYPSFTWWPTNAISIIYKGGIATQSPVVEAGDDIKIPILMLVGGLYENRESSLTTQQIATMYGVEDFIEQNVATYIF